MNSRILNSGHDYNSAVILDFFEIDEVADSNLGSEVDVESILMFDSAELLGHKLMVDKRQLILTNKDCQIIAFVKSVISRCKLLVNIAGFIAIFCLIFAGLLSDQLTVEAMLSWAGALLFIAALAGLLVWIADSLRRNIKKRLKKHLNNRLS